MNSELGRKANLTKAEQAEVQKVLNFARSNPHYAAAVLAPMLRCCSSRSLPRLMGVMEENGLRPYMEVANGCYVAKAPGRLTQADRALAAGFAGRGDGLDAAGVRS